MKRARWLLMFTLLLAVAGFVAVPQTAQAQGATVLPSAGPPGTLFEFLADGFTPGEQVGFWINAPDGRILEVVDSDGDVLVEYASSDGGVYWNVVVSANEPDGLYTMVAQGIDSGFGWTIPFEIDATLPPPDPPQGVEASVVPEVGPPGTPFTFEANGFEPGEPVGVWINTPDGRVLEIINPDGDVLVLYANGDGAVSWVVTIASNEPAGLYTMVAQGTNTGSQWIIPFEIR